MQAMDTITIRLDESTRAALIQAAARDDRKPRALARLLVKEGLKRRGLLIHDEELQPYILQRGGQA